MVMNNIYFMVTGNCMLKITDSHRETGGNERTFCIKIRLSSIFLFALFSLLSALGTKPGAEEYISY